MRFWITTHWAPEADDDSPVPRGVYVRDGREKAGENLRAGDLVLIYQAVSGPTVIRKSNNGQDQRIGRKHGSGGIVVIAKALDRLRPNRAEKPTRYVGRAPILWRWYADTEALSTNGFVSADELKRVLNYSSGYRMRGFGDYNSGLKEIEEAQYDKLVDLFKRRGRKVFKREVVAQTRRKQVFEGIAHGESDAHKDLKEYVASDPARILKEKGLRTLEVEFSFDSGDRADLVLEDHVGRVIGLEIEVAVDPSDVTGILQAIKYRHMLAFVHRCKFNETRSFLVAYSITQDIKAICNAYAVECFIVNRDDVRRWKEGQVLRITNRSSPPSPQGSVVER